LPTVYFKLSVSKASQIDMEILFSWFTPIIHSTWKI
jgi:hypothetical protein